MMSASRYDIGTIVIADNILLRPGKLTKDEHQSMQEHTHLGAKTLSNPLSYLLRVGSFCCHYISCNGATGLVILTDCRSMNLPIEARIVPLVDVFDALTSERPYKKTWFVKDEIAPVIEQSGLHFDPSLFTLFAA